MDDLRPDSSGWDLLHTVLGELALPMAVMDDSQRLVHVSPALESLADTRFEPIPSEHVASYFNLHDPSGIRSLDPSELTLVRACAGESVQDSYVTVKPKVGPVRLLRCTAAPLRSTAGEIRGALLLAADATDEQPIVSLPPEIRRQRLGVLQHELRTPLAVLLGHAELLQDLGPALPEEARESLAAMLRAGERLTLALDSVSAILDGRVPPD
ncbi:histidine kinase dimerization/phospho-acceptor domain-containing protein [Nocardioides sp.]|uniref:histidine kinase dimerization/phospho-acceptor domain-containing protein n=1 Tax=Nocardioides sp. TaxID=35761 RepID=UPI0026243A8D|nr:histidine kinase dimerization/phospho-acceptor domain-containing protein [Nocardioides sp.]MCW2735724.1 Signal transduction histidine kinase CheA [Nocardioides sp.]